MFQWKQRRERETNVLESLHPYQWRTSLEAYQRFCCNKARHIKTRKKAFKIIPFEMFEKDLKRLTKRGEIDSDCYFEGSKELDKLDVLGVPLPRGSGYTCYFKQTNVGSGKRIKKKKVHFGNLVPEGI